MFSSREGAICAKSLGRWCFAAAKRIWYENIEGWTNDDNVSSNKNRLNSFSMLILKSQGWGLLEAPIETSRSCNDSFTFPCVESIRFTFYQRDLLVHINLLTNWKHFVHVSSVTRPYDPPSKVQEIQALKLENLIWLRKQLLWASSFTSQRRRNERVNGQRWSMDIPRCK